MNKLSIEELIKYAEGKVASLTKVIDQSAFTNIKERLIEERQLAQFGLDALREALKGDQVPVGEVVGWDRHIDENIIEWTEAGSQLPVGTELFTVPQKPVVVPEINEDLVEILGRPNFTCSRIAGLFRRNGADIKRKSENEQAFVIHWLIGVYLAHGSEWRATAEAELKSIADKIKAESYTVKTEVNHAEP